jgi:alkanesulfonate monooxygenase SsuD/methylene tetrahydromethanopterin reductase-like flavin-dependent oxidoreductase (luciferase family)
MLEPPLSPDSCRARLGVGLWTMQSSRQSPCTHSALYRRFAEDAMLVERHGFHSVWMAEHRVWYDGWCPAMLHAQAFAAARTRRVRFGGAMLLAPQHDPTALARAALTLDRLSGGRVDLGLGLGHRDAEFDALGISRTTRGRRMEAALSRLEAVWSGALGDEPEDPGRRPMVWVGGMARAAIERAAEHGHGLLLPQSMRSERLAPILDIYATRAGRPAPLGVLRDVWIESDAARARAFRARMRQHYTEEIGAWWMLKGTVGFRNPPELARQLEMLDSSGVVGGPEEVAESLAGWLEIGAQLVVARVNFDFVEQAALHEQVARLAEEVTPLLGTVAIA